MDGAGYGVCSLGGKVTVLFLSPFVNLDREPVFFRLCRPQQLLARRLWSNLRPGNEFACGRPYDIGGSDYTELFDAFGMTTLF